ncbi:Hypothetical predicted protein [Octopus vulgaris]|uniref:Uncharacterized protein n=1 Tax=Octopus vulgaris TaxID=6645 RepID=A0AA36BLM0_OCTVU|nr:Hypothetical predicted protein [Octopus vulgaris]
MKLSKTGYYWLPNSHRQFPIFTGINASYLSIEESKYGCIELSNPTVLAAFMLLLLLSSSLQLISLSHIFPFGFTTLIDTF